MSSNPNPGADKNDFIDQCKSLRQEIKATAKEIWARRNHPAITLDPRTMMNDIESKTEADANLVLAFRHLEDAAMRLGKAIQAIDGGVSVYDKEK